MHLGLGETAKAGDAAIALKTVVKYLGSCLAWNLSFVHERRARIAVTLSGQPVAGSTEVQIQAQPLEGTDSRSTFERLHGFCRSGGQFLGGRAESVGNRLGRRLFAALRKTWDNTPRDKSIPTKEVHRKLGIVPIAMELILRRQGCATRKAEQVPQAVQRCHGVFDRAR